VRYLFCLAVLVAGCTGHRAADTTIPNHDPDLWVRVIEVVEDSRCPEGAVCAWEGRLTLRWEAGSGDERLTFITEGLMSDGGPYYGESPVVEIWFDEVGSRVTVKGWDGEKPNVFLERLGDAS
jgi:hypothetical protein